MARKPEVSVDPARDAASVLRRLGFLTLMVGLPVSGLAGRTAPVFVVAIGIALVASAAFFDRAVRPPGRVVLELSGSPVVWALAVLAGWALLSVIWAPAPAPAASLWLGAVATGIAGLAGLFALPDRMRAANLYPAPIGVGIGVVAAIVFAVTAGGTDPDASQRLSRCLSILVLVLWPAVGWLRSRGRDIEALVLAVGTGIAASLGPSLAPILALAVGTFAYLIAHLAPRVGVVAVGAACGFLVLLAPVLVATGGPIAASWLPAAPAAALEAWRPMIVAEPLRWFTGHGLASHPVRGVGVMSPATASVLGFWYELGLVGAVAVAVAAVAGLRGAHPRFGPLLPAFSAAVATGFALSAAGTERGAAWPSAVVAAVLVFVAAERGQFRTRRPRLIRLGRSRAA